MLVVLSNFDPFHANGLFPYPLKASQNQRFSGLIERDQQHKIVQPCQNNSLLKTFQNFKHFNLWKTFLTLSWRRPKSYRNQSVDLLCKTMDWFPYDIGLPHERVKDFKNVNLIAFCLWLHWKMADTLSSDTFSVLSSILTRTCSQSNHPTFLKWLLSRQRRSIFLLLLK